MTTVDISQRKKDHLKYALSDQVQMGNPGFDNYRFIHNALPEIDFDKIDTSTIFLNKRVNYPVFISCMTGGVEKGGVLNINLAKAAQETNIPLGVGSQRAALVHPEIQTTYKVVRKYAPDVPVLANIGLVQLNYGYGLAELQKCVDMVDANALVVHINPIQEVIQPEGDRNFSNLLPKLAKIIEKLKVPVIAKEVGFGLSGDVVSRLYNIGVRIFDTAGWGGTNWAMVEGLRGKADRNLGELFSQWGIPTAESIKQLSLFNSKIKSRNKFQYSIYNIPYTILGSGGIRSGVDIAKALAMGADMAGIAAPFAKAALISSEEVVKLVHKYALELKVSMMGVGAKNIIELKKAEIFSPGCC